MPEPWDDDYGALTARLYDAAYAALSRRRGDRAFYRALAREAGGPVLELGCGTGRVLLDVAAEGLPCTGLDSSQAMLDALRARPGGAGVRLVRAALQDFDLGEARFQLIYAAFRVFQHLYTAADQLACLACVRRHLAPGGLLAFDVFNPRLERIALGAEPEIEDLRFQTPEGVPVVRYATVLGRDPVEQVQRLRFRYEQRAGDERPPVSESIELRMRWYHRFELEHLLARAGFDDVVIYGDFDRSPARAGCPEYVVVAGSSHHAQHRDREAR
jgi:SAM-dependent methyltransferase